MATELATVTNFNLQTFDADISQAIAEEMDGLGTIPFDRVKIPSGGGLAFELPGEDADHPVSATEIKGVILYHHPVNAYWKDQYSGNNEKPDCSSLDGHQGVNRDTGLICDCASCPMNQFGSDGEGKACKNTHRVYILLESSPVPVILTLPPTSLSPLRDYIGKRVLLKGKRSSEVITKITLKKDKSAGGITYSKAVFELVGQLPAEQLEAVSKMTEMVKATYRNVDADDADYEMAPSAPKTDEDGFMNVPANDDNLPFA